MDDDCREKAEGARPDERQKRKRARDAKARERKRRQRAQIPRQAETRSGKEQRIGVEASRWRVPGAHDHQEQHRVEHEPALSPMRFSSAPTSDSLLSSGRRCRWTPATAVRT